ncbi:hypothetical protein NITGR_1050023 [Nitrospina gracilis 3/211]|uniref:Uncharacterized protein n=2 Tax=Nitrospina TaxID=35800 RepID=M1YVX1_NITG3|nr:hypothetical protein [Nitrospina sp. Nb-3]MCF8722261.1 hypothetical protein [Nitrospina sp. Nb-3]CCQ89460.1 hypothetical protein NITGR_1050023 [Nitrospina gracilis 3/211]
MSGNEKKKQLWQSVLADKSFVKKDASESGAGIKSKIDKVYDELEIDKRYQEVRETEGRTEDAPADGPRAS